MAQRRKSLRFAPFEDKYPYLVNYYKENGHTNVPTNYEYEDEETEPWAMGTWVGNLRHSGLKVTPEHRKLLNDLDFDWKNSKKANGSAPKSTAQSRSHAASNSEKPPPKLLRSSSGGSPPKQIDWNEWYNLPDEQTRLKILSNHYPPEWRKNWNNTNFEEKLAIYARYILRNMESNKQSEAEEPTKVSSKHRDTDSNFCLGRFVKRLHGMTNIDEDRRKKLEAIGFYASGSVEREQGTETYGDSKPAAAAAPTTNEEEEEDPKAQRKRIQTNFLMPFECENEDDDGEYIPKASATKIPQHSVRDESGRFAKKPSGSAEHEQSTPLARKRKNQELEPSHRLGKHPRATKKAPPTSYSSSRTGGQQGPQKPANPKPAETAPPVSNSSSHPGGQQGSQKRASSRQANTSENNRLSQTDHEDPSPLAVLANQFATRADLDAKIEEIDELVDEANKTDEDEELADRALEASKDLKAMKKLRDSEKFRDINDLEMELAGLQQELETVSQSTADKVERLHKRRPLLTKIKPLKGRIKQEKARANFHAANKQEAPKSNKQEAPKSNKQEAPESIEIIDVSDDEDDERKPAAVGASGSQQTGAAKPFRPASSCDI